MQSLVDDFDLHSCPSVSANFIVSKYTANSYAARSFCEAHGAVFPEFKSNAEISLVFDCLNQDYTESLKTLSFFIRVSYLADGAQKLVFDDEDLDQSLWGPYDPNGDCTLPSNANVCCAELRQIPNHNGDLTGSLIDSDVDCSHVHEYFLCRIPSYVTILGDECALDLHSCSHTCADQLLGYIC